MPRASLSSLLRSNSKKLKMGKIHGCLKGLFISFNSIFLGFGFLLIIGTIKAGAYSNKLSAFGGPSLGWSWGFALGFVGISCLGIYAGYSEKPLAIKTFAGFMGIGMAIMLIFGIIVVDARNKVRGGFLDTSSELTKHLMAEEEMRTMLDQIQKSVHCCGVVRAEDWGNSIPNSCECLGYGCKSKPQGASGPSQIYQQTCGEFIYSSISYIFEVAIAFCFVFAVIALLGLLLSLLMNHQVKRIDHIGGGCTIMNNY